MSDNPSWSSGYNSVNSFGYNTFDGNYMYFASRNGIIFQTNLNGSINTSNFANLYGSVAPGGCLVHNGYLYITNFNGGYGDGAITRVSLADNTKINIWAQVGSGASSIVTDGTYFYISCYYDGRVDRVLISNPATVNIFLTGVANIRQLAISGSYLYIASDNPYNSLGVTRALLTNPSAYTLWASLPSESFGLAIFESYLYVSTISNNIYKILLTNSTSQTIFKANTSSGLSGLTYYNNYLYAFTTSNSYIAQYYLPSDIPPIPPCFKEGTKILTMKGYKMVQDLRKGDMVKTLRNDYKAIEMIGKKEFIHHPTPENRVKEQLYICSKPEFDQILEPLVITGCHSILVGEFVSEAQRQKTIEVNGDIYLTDNKYRLPACAHHGTTVYDHPGTYTIYHLALENEDYFMNYGIYANGLLVESCSRRYLKERSNMELIE
jgi:hypothetical protein